MLPCGESDDAAKLTKPARRMDCRVKPGNDETEDRSRGAAAPEFCRYHAQGAERDLRQMAPTVGSAAFSIKSGHS
jgi:hypothetical protein